MASKKVKGRYIERFLKKAAKTISEGIKNADKILEESVVKADQTLNQAVKLGNLAATEAQKRSGQLHRQARIESMRLKSEGLKKINQGITTARQISQSRERDLEMLKKLDKLRKSGTITEREFQTKKKQILSRI